MFGQSNFSRTLIASACLVALSVTARAETLRPIDVPPGELSAALQAVAKQSGAELIYSAEQIEGVRTNGVRGDLTAESAVSKLLEGTQLKLKVQPSGVLLISDVREGDKATGMVLAQNAINSSMTEQTTVSDTKGDSSTLEEIVVTAQRREQKLQDVPFGITALGTEELERMGATGTESYLAVVPGVHYNSFGRGRSTIVIRGVSTEKVGATSGSNPTNQGTTEIYLDDVPLTDRFGAWTNPDPDTFDLERVEVLRGPQGTLFGSGSLGGAVRLITNKPNLSDFQSKFELGVENTDGGDDGNAAAAMVNLPLVTDKLALRVAASRKKVGGYIDGIVTNQDDINSEKNEVVRALLKYQPTEALSVQLTGMYEDQRLDGNVTSFRQAEDGGPYEFNPDAPEYSTARQRILSATLGYDFGSVNLTSTSTYADRDSFLLNDWGQLLGKLFDNNQGIFADPDNAVFDPDTALTYRTQDSQRFAQEIRLSSAADTRLQWTVGGFFLNTKQQFYSYWRSGVPAIQLAGGRGNGEIRESAAFGEATYRISDRFMVTAGARWFKSSVEGWSSSDPGALLFGGATAPIETTDSALTPKVSVSFYPTEEVHLYATASKGYRIGQTNGGHLVNPAIPRSFDPDSLWNYELGVKSSWFDGRLQANVAGYYIDWTDIQLTTYLYTADGPVFASDHTANAGDARIKGVEAELTLQPISGIEFGTSLAYTDAELTFAAPGVAIQGIVAGARLPGSAKYTATSYIQYDNAIGSNFRGYLRLIDLRVGDVLGSLNPAANPLTDTGPWHRLDLRAGLQWDKYELALSVQNLTNNDDIVQSGGGGFPAFGYYSYPVTRLRPRTVGLTFRADFK